MELTQVHDTTGVVLAVALELSCGSWKVALQDGRRERPAVYSYREERPEARVSGVLKCVEAQKRKWGLPVGVPVVLVYEAGQDGFWIARALQARGYEVYVTDPASVVVSRVQRRAKTDRLDAMRLVNALRGWLRGERDCMRMVHIPSVQAEAQRQLSRERGLLQKEVAQHRDRMRKLLRTVGCWQAVQGDLGVQLQGLRGYDGQPLPEPLRARLEHEGARLQLVEQQLAALERSLVAQLPPATQARVEQLERLKGVGWVGALRLVLELFWREFSNRRQVGSCVGLVPQPYDSGSMRSDQGISKQSNARVRALAIQLAWLWLRWQPDSELTRWFAQRTAGSGPNKRARRIAIVAVARRLMISLWRYLEHGELPPGACFKA
jgi:transposase